ncbi:MAG TPA: hypothetical protein VKV73_23960 [Chloroflexota bacterium]|nr:hypothetical protein [Chloroflexota bacterium]
MKCRPFLVALSVVALLMSACAQSSANTGSASAPTAAPLPPTAAPSPTAVPSPTPAPSPTPDLVALCGPPTFLATYDDREAARSDLRTKYATAFREADFNNALGNGQSVQRARQLAGVPPC